MATTSAGTNISFFPNMNQSSEKAQVGNDIRELIALYKGLINEIELGWEHAANTHATNR